MMSAAITRVVSCSIEPLRSRGPRVRLLHDCPAYGRVSLVRQTTRSGVSYGGVCNTGESACFESQTAPSAIGRFWSRDMPVEVLTGGKSQPIFAGRSSSFFRCIREVSR